MLAGAGPGTGCLFRAASFRSNHPLTATCADSDSSWFPSQLPEPQPPQPLNGRFRQKWVHSTSPVNLPLSRSQVRRFLARARAHLAPRPSSLSTMLLNGRTCGKPRTAPWVPMARHVRPKQSAGDVQIFDSKLRQFLLCSNSLQPMPPLFHRKGPHMPEVRLGLLGHDDSSRQTPGSCVEILVPRERLHRLPASISAKALVCQLRIPDDSSQTRSYPPRITHLKLSYSTHAFQSSSSRYCPLRICKLEPRQEYVDSSELARGRLLHAV